MMHALIRSILASMTSPDDFAKSFDGHPVPPLLEQLLVFQQRVGFENYAEGFGLLHDDKSAAASWCDKPEFLAALLPFAQASCGGSFYALWNDGSGASTSEMPVLVFGDEGGMHVVASRIDELLTLLAHDVEPSVDWDSVSYYKGDDHEPRDGHADYVRWLQERGLTTDAEPKTIVAAAKAKHQAAFDAWKSRYIDG